MPMTRPRRPRAVFIAVLLLLALGLAGLLAIEAHATFKYHRATAERVLRDYARLAAARFAQRTAQQAWYYAVMPTADALHHAGATKVDGPLPAPGRLPIPPESRNPHLADFLKAARYTFRLDVPTGRLAIAGEAPSAEGRRWLTDTLPVHARTIYSSDDEAAAIVDTAAGRPRMIVYTVIKDRAGAPRTITGIEADPGALQPFYTMGADKFPLLPRPLTGGVIYDSIGSVIVRYAGGFELYRSPVQYEPRFMARDSLEAMMGGLQVQVALRPEMASQLVIGGLPRSRLPMLLGVLALTAGLIVTALVQLRREYDLARLRTDFVSGVSHELRTPLAQIRMFSETLLLGRVRSEEEQRRSLEIVDQEARRLTHLVENLLHFSRSERQVAQVVPEPTLLGPLVQAVVESFAPLAAARDVTVRVDTSRTGGAPAIALADPAALRQMLLNLLDNAVKYGPAGQTVTVRVESDGGRGGDDTRLRISVEDQGPGVPGADRERVWERFWRLERDRGSSVAGTGIGLAVVRELAALHRGRAWVEDVPGGTGGGARFVVELPTPAAEREAAPAAPAGPGAARPSPSPTPAERTRV
jgi:signal transduction histidine kinase